MHSTNFGKPLLTFFVKILCAKCCIMYMHVCCCCRGQKGQLKRELTEGGRKVEMLQSSRSDQLLAYGEWMPRLVAAIRAAQGRFRKPPKGPIGASLSLSLSLSSLSPATHNTHAHYCMSLTQSTHATHTMQVLCSSCMTIAGPLPLSQY